MRAGGGGGGAEVEGKVGRKDQEEGFGRGL